jgi:hypothetical protein
MNAEEDDGILSGQSSISWMGFTHTNNNSEDDVIGIPLWCTDIDRFMEFMHDGIEHSSNSEDNHLAKITVSPTLQVYSTENENSVPWMVTLVAIADGRAWEGLIKNILAGRTTEIPAFEVVQVWPESPLKKIAWLPSSRAGSSQRTAEELMKRANDTISLNLH